MTARVAHVIGVRAIAVALIALATSAAASAVEGEGAASAAPPALGLLTPGGVEALLSNRSCLGPSVVLFASSANAEEFQEATADLIAASRSLTEAGTCFGVLDCDRWRSACLDHNVVRPPAILVNPRNSGPSRILRGTLTKKAVMEAVATMIQTTSRVMAISKDNVEAFVTERVLPWKLLYFPGEDLTSVVTTHLLSADGRLWPHVHYGQTKDDALTYAFGVAETPLWMLQCGHLEATRRFMKPEGENPLTVGALREWVMSHVTTFEMETFECFGKSLVEMQEEDAQALYAQDENQEISSDYEMMAFGTEGCQAGFEVTSVQECELAIRSLQLEPNPRWVSSYDGLPRFCSFREQTSEGNEQHMHFNSAASGTGREDLAPVCKAPKLPELTAASRKEHCGGDGFCFVYLSDGPVTREESAMLLSLRDRFKGSLLEQGTLMSWTWMDVKANARFQKLLMPPALPSSVVLAPRKRPRFSLMKHAEMESGEALPADEAGLAQHVLNLLSGDARFTQVTAEQLQEAWDGPANTAASDGAKNKPSAVDALKAKVAEKQASAAKDAPKTPILQKQRKSTKQQTGREGSDASAGNGDDDSRMSKYQVLGLGAAGCPKGLEIRSAKACEEAIRALGLNPMPKWVSAYDHVPRFCSLRASSSAKDPERMHFNSANSGQGRQDLAPVCLASAPESNEVPTVPGIPELSRRTQKLLGPDALCVIYLREGAITQAETDMLLRLQAMFDQQAKDQKVKLRWMWLDLRMERKFKSVFDAEVFPSAVVLDPTGRPRFATLQHREEDGEPQPADEAGLTQLVSSALAGDAEFTQTTLTKLNQWSERRPAPHAA